MGHSSPRLLLVGAGVETRFVVEQLVGAGRLYGATALRYVSDGLDDVRGILTPMTAQI